MITIQADVLSAYISKIFAASGSSEEEANIIAEHLIGANLRGHDSHGVIRTLSYITGVNENRFDVNGKFSIVQETPSTAVADGGMNLGQVAAHHAMNLSIQKAHNSVLI